MTQEQIFGQVLGFLIGIFSSWVFWYFLIRIKPKVDISPVASFNSNQGTIAIKIINKGRRQIIDLQATMFIAERRSETSFAPIREIKLQYDFIVALSPQGSKRIWWHSPIIGIFITGEGKEILEIISQKGLTSDNQRKIIFTLSATDSLSGSKIVRRNAYGLRDIKHGKFVRGESFVVQDIVNKDMDDEKDIPA